MAQTPRVCSFRIRGWVSTMKVTWWRYESPVLLRCVCIHTDVSREKGEPRWFMTSGLFSYKTRPIMMFCSRSLSCLFRHFFTLFQAFFSTVGFDASSSSLITKFQLPPQTISHSTARYCEKWSWAIARWMGDQTHLVLLVWHIFSVYGTWKHYISGKYWANKNANLAHSLKESFLHSKKKNGLKKGDAASWKRGILKFWNQGSLRRT
jgi:hypothetical protein